MSVYLSTDKQGGEALETHHTYICTLAYSHRRVSLAQFLPHSFWDK